MELTLTFRHFEGSNSLRDHAEKSLNRMEKFCDNIRDAHMILDIEKHRNLVEITVNVYGQTLKAMNEANDMYVSIDGAVDKLERQLKKHNNKLKSHRRSRKISEALVEEE
jgi:putative sigma-54 modulation protein